MLSHTKFRITCGLALALGTGTSLASSESAPAHGTPAAAVPAPTSHAPAETPPATAFDEIGLPIETDYTYTAVADTLADAGSWALWLTTLESTVAGRAAGSQPEPGLLYPLDNSHASTAGSGAQPYRHLAIAKAVSQLEEGAAAKPEGHAKAGHGESRGGSHGDGHAPETEANRAGSPLLALANARNYLNLSEYDKALEWYAHASARDVGGDFRRETGRERLAAAICARDTVAAGLAVAATLQATDLVGREAEVVLAFRWLLNRNDAAGLGWLLNHTAAPEVAADARVAFWRAYTLSALDRRPECLAQLNALLALGGNGRVLNERERCWVLTATADLLLLQGSTSAAESLYTRLATSTVPSLRQWGQLQSAGLAFVGHRYTEAGAGYREICQNDKQGLWGPHACAMADIAARLGRLMSEGERYGADAHFRR
jgi:hypothetical protein